MMPESLRHSTSTELKEASVRNAEVFFVRFGHSQHLIHLHINDSSLSELPAGLLV